MIPNLLSGRAAFQVYFQLDGFHFNSKVESATSGTRSEIFQRYDAAHPGFHPTTPTYKKVEVARPIRTAH